MKIYTKSASGKLPPTAPNFKLNDPSLYMPSEGLRAAVDVALHLNQPLLLTGEPGTGKTQLAYHLAHFFGLETPLVFISQTSSVAKDLFYRYDNLAHFQYAQNYREPLTNDEIEHRFIQFNALGQAILSNQRRVVLIDEIDKAPRDFPNDILTTIENLQFLIPEIGKLYRATPENRPIIIMTSNSEKNLPDAFLRRVIFYHIKFPSAEDLLHIISSKVDGYSEKELEYLVEHFEEIRSGDTAQLRKKPATAELINWALFLKKMNFSFQKWEEREKAKLSNEEKAELENILRQSYSIIAKNSNDLAEVNQMLTSMMG